MRTPRKERGGRNLTGFNRRGTPRGVMQRPSNVGGISDSPHELPSLPAALDGDMERTSPSGAAGGFEDVFDTEPGDALWILRRERFYTRAIGPMRQPAVYHWMDDNNPHIDVYVLGRSPGRHHETMVTGGMADRPMPGVPPGCRTARRVELLVDLPRAEDRVAMILREIASLPFNFGYVFEEGALIEGSGPILPGSRLSHAVLARRKSDSLDGFLVEGENVSFLSVLFISDEELRFGREHGGVALLGELERAGLSETLRVERESLI
jgi:Suppressor of fused protein (SUFU)